MRPQRLLAVVLAACLCWLLLVGSVGADGIISNGGDGIDDWPPNDDFGEIEDLPSGGPAQPADADHEPVHVRSHRVGARWTRYGDDDEWTDFSMVITWFTAVVHVCIL